MDRKPRVLYATPILRHPPLGGPELRVENSIKALSQISELHIYYQSLSKKSNLDPLYYKSFCNYLYTPSFKVKLYYYINAITRKLTLVTNKFTGNKFPKTSKIQIPQENIYSDLINISKNINADVIWLGYGNISYPLLKYIKTNSNFMVVCDTDSVWSRYLLRGLPFAKSEVERKRIEYQGHQKEEEELWGTRLADVTTAVSEVDADYYRDLADDPQKIKIFSNVIDMESYQHSQHPPQNFKKPCIYLAGSFWHNSPMEEAARWVITYVMPIIKLQIPNIHLYIVGRGSAGTLSDINDPSITITGQLPSVLPYLCNADVALVPLKFESGTRFKILEAGACGIPIVSTTLGAEGIPVTHGENILIADDPEKFANSILKLLIDIDYAEKIGNNLNKLIEAEFGIPKLAKEGKEILDYLRASKK